MAEPKEDDFLDDIDDAEADVFAEEMDEIDDEALELDELRVDLHEMIEETDDLRLYPMCRECRGKSLNQHGEPAVNFPRVHII